MQNKYHKLQRKQTIMETYKTYRIFGLTFQSSFQLNGPAEIGLDAQEFNYTDELNKAVVYLSFVKMDVEMQQNMGMPDSELLAYAKSTFIGTTKAAEEYIERKILGQPSKGELITSKIPVPSAIELHFINLPDGCKYLVSVKSEASFPADKLESLISEICDTLS